jgi:hypothetical protein
LLFVPESSAEEVGDLVQTKKAMKKVVGNTLHMAAFGLHKFTFLPSLLFSG